MQHSIYSFSFNMRYSIVLSFDLLFLVLLILVSIHIYVYVWRRAPSLVQGALTETDLPQGVFLGRRPFPVLSQVFHNEYSTDTDLP